jgi:hypothetical protein
MGLLATIGSLFGTGKTPEELQRESAALDAQLAADIERKRQQNQNEIYLAAAAGEDTTEAQADLDARSRIEDAHLAQQFADTADITDSIDRAAEEGYQEGKANVSGAAAFFKRILGDTIGGALSFIPWYVWVIALVIALGAVALFVINQFGGLARLLKRAR